MRAMQKMLFAGAVLLALKPMASRQGRKSPV
jgi:hypothetical protein